MDYKSIKNRLKNIGLGILFTGLIASMGYAIGIVYNIENERNQKKNKVKRGKH